MVIKFNFYTVFFGLVLLYGVFQYGRVYDKDQQPQITVDQPQYNHMVQVDDCTIVMDTLGNINSIWYQDQPYTLDTTILADL
jgi:hypothetical protein